MWSQLPKLPGSTRPCQGCPLTCYDEKLLILTQERKMYELLAEKNQWRINQTLTSANGFGSRYFDIAVLAAGSENMLFVIYHSSTYSASSDLQIFDGYSWSDPVSLQLNVLEERLEQEHISVAVHKMIIYVNNEDTIYRIHIPTDERAPKDSEVTSAQGSPNGEAKAVAQNVSTSIDVPPKKGKLTEDHNLNLGTPVKIPISLTPTPQVCSH
jgi:hypothetical protein